jgi:phosphatidylglycerophosphate synthase
MLDALVRPLIDPPLNAAGRRLARTGLTADAVTLAGLALGLSAAALIALGFPGLALLPLLMNRLADGLDGAVARASSPTSLGGFHDIIADFAFYGAIPLGFVALDPAANGLAGAALLASFYVNGGSFLGFAILAERHGMQTAAQGRKTLYYSGGLLEGAETIAFFSVICLLPAAFTPLALGFAALCILTAVLRVRAARRLFAPRSGTPAE